MSLDLVANCGELPPLDGVFMQTNLTASDLGLVGLSLHIPECMLDSPLYAWSFCGTGNLTLRL